MIIRSRQALTGMSKPFFCTRKALVGNAKIQAIPAAFLSLKEF